MTTDEELLSKLEESTRNAQRLQHETLQTIIQRNGGVRYLQRFIHRFNAQLTADNFRRLVPLSSYDDYEDHINSMADGEDDSSSFLSVDPLVCFFYSSGTSSMKPKLIPYFDSTHSKAASFLAHQGSGAVLRRLFPPRPSISKILWFIYAGNVTKSKGGFKVMAASSFPLHSSGGGRSGPNPSLMLSMCVSPKEVILGSNLEQQMYCHLLCGLSNPDSIDCIRTPYASGLVRALRLLESKWEQLCNDIEQGSLSSEITEFAMKETMTKLLDMPQPELAKRIRAICGRRDWGGILGKLWPNVRYVTCVTTGIMEQYYTLLKYYAGELPVLGGDYFASECCVAINLDRIQPPELTRFVMLPTAAYFEFLPYNELGDRNSVAEETVDFSGVEIGKAYEVVVTTYRGLYRYRLGDIVRVIGFYNSSPQVEYMMRAPKGPFEILTERDLMSAMESFKIMLRDEAMVQVEEFTSFFDSESSLKRVSIIAEVNEGCLFLQKEKLDESVHVLRKGCCLLKECIQNIYEARSVNEKLGSLVVSIVKPGSFDKLLQLAMEKGVPASQYKPPKIIRNLEVVESMKASAVVTVTVSSNSICSDEEDTKG